MGKMKNLDPRYTLESALDEIEHITKAYNWVASLHTEAVVENMRLQQQLDRVAAYWYVGLGYWIKRKLGLIKYKDL